MRLLAFGFVIVSSSSLALDLPKDLDDSEIELASAIVEAGMSQALSPTLTRILEDRAVQIAVAIDDVKGITERDSTDLASIKFPLDVRTPIETLTHSMPHAFSAFSVSYVDTISEIYASAYSSVVVATQALLGERQSILDTLRDPEADHSGLADRLLVIESDISIGQAVSRILEAQARFLVQTRGRMEFIQNIDP